MKKLFTIITFACCMYAGAAMAQIMGTFGVCVGGSTTLVDTLRRTGVWSSSNTSVASVDASSGSVTGISVGTSTISFVAGSSTSTAVFRVSPLPSAIMGPSSVCTMASVTLSNSVSGGTWNSSSSSISVIPSTGVATGVTAGFAIINYTMGIGCQATHSMTVNSTDPGYILGPSTVCVGGATTFSNPVSGGTWSSMSTSIATVGLTTGVVTGVSLGNVVLFYTVTGICGTAMAYDTINVVSGTYAGTITGPTSVMAGYAITLSPSVSGGTWSSSNTSVASVDLYYGNVHGVAPGTSVLSYTVLGCSGPASVTTTITVVPLTGIAGDVLFSGSGHRGNVKVWLIRYNSSTMNLYAHDSLVVYSPGASAHYHFIGALVSDSIRVKAAIIDSTGSTFGYIPTYHTGSSFWSSASVFYHTAGSYSAGKDINMGVGAMTAGPGFIAGNVTTGANKGTAGDPPAVGLQMHVINSAGTILQTTYTDASGNYSFSNLPVGETYRIYPELINYASIPYTSITLTTASPSKAAANFQQRTISKVISPIMVGVPEIRAQVASINTFPNPTSGKLLMQYEAPETVQGVVTLTNISGQVVYTSALQLTAGIGNASFDFSGFADGLYLLTFKSEAINYHTKMAISH